MSSRWGEGPQPFAWMYKTKTWDRLRSVHIGEHPLCEACEEQGRTTLATVVHHRTPHKGRWHLFVDLHNLQAVCKKCHDGELRFIEYKGYSNRIGEDGWPSDTMHPANKS